MPLSTSYLVVKASELARDAKEFRECLEVLAKILEEELRSRAKRFVDLKRVARLVVFGDIHGDLATLEKLARRTNLDDVLQSDGIAVFLGDYVDRGMYQIEVVAFLSLVKQEYGQRVVLLRGNHEPPPWLPPMPHDYPQHLRSRFGYEQGEELYQLSQKVFSLLPLTAILRGEALFVHGGPPLSRVDRFDSVDEILDFGEEDREAVEEVLWSDPIDEDIEWCPNFMRGAGKYWGRKATAKVLEKLGVKMIVRAHEPALNGYKLDHGGRVLTLFSIKGYPYGNPYAAALALDLTDDRWHERIENYIVTV